MGRSPELSRREFIRRGALLVAGGASLFLPRTEGNRPVAQAAEMRAARAVSISPEALLDESGFTGRMSSVEAASPYPGDDSVWERVLIQPQAEPMTPDRPQKDGSKYNRITHPEPLSIFTGPEGFVGLRYELTAGSQLGVMFGNRVGNNEYTERTVGLLTKGDKATMVVYEDGVGKDKQKFEQEIGTVTPGSGILGLAFAEGGRRVGAFTGTGEVTWLKGYESSLPTFDPARPTQIGAWTYNSEGSIGTVVAYQPKNTG